MLWKHGLLLVAQLRPACSRFRSFLWMSVALAGFSLRSDLLGVSSFVRALGLKSICYDRLLDFFHSDSLNLDKLTLLRRKLVFSSCSHALRNSFPEFLADSANSSPFEKFLRDIIDLARAKVSAIPAK